MLLREGLQDRLLHAGRLYKGRVRLNKDIALTQPLGDILARTPGVDLVLADADLAAASALDIVLQLFEMLDAKVGHTQGPNLACLLGLDQRLPGAQAGFLAAVGSMDQNTGEIRFSIS